MKLKLRDYARLSDVHAVGLGAKLACCDAPVLGHFGHTEESHKGKAHAVIRRFHRMCGVRTHRFSATSIEERESSPLIARVSFNSFSSRPPLLAAIPPTR